MNICILLTATIAPHNVPNLKRVDHLQRENDYLEAIKFYSKFKIPIVFCENSNTKSESILNFFKNKKIYFEYFSFESKKSIEGKGKGEAEILSYAFLNSKILRKSKKIVKITGRYKIKNLLKQVNNLNDNTIYVNLTKSLSYSDSRFFIFNTFFYEHYFSKEFNKIDEINNIFMEHILLKSTLNYIADFNNWSLPKQKIIYEGVYGTNNTSYKKNKIKQLLKEVFYKLKVYLLKSNL